MGLRSDPIIGGMDAMVDGANPILLSVNLSRVLGNISPVLQFNSNSSEFLS
jgi:hypothetical protein